MGNYKLVKTDLEVTKVLNNFFQCSAKSSQFQIFDRGTYLETMKDLTMKANHSSIFLIEIQYNNTGNFSFTEVD